MDTTVLIVGAGPTGLTLACDLVRRGVAVRLIEAAPGPRPGSRGKGVQPRTLEIFEDLGIAGRVLTNGRLAMPMHAIGSDGTVIEGGAVPESLLDRPDIPYPASLITPQWRTEEALRDRLTELGGTVEFGTTLVSFSQSGGQVTAVLERNKTVSYAAAPAPVPAPVQAQAQARNKTVSYPLDRGRERNETVSYSGGTETITARWLVGCDGGHSTVRKQAGIGFTGETRDEVRMLLADAETDGLDRTAWRAWTHPEGLVSLCPLPSTGLFQFGASVAPGQDAGLGRANLQAILERRTGRTDIRLHEPRWTSLWRANIRLADRYRAGRVFLAGDAAHVHSPAGGQGMNTGIQDAHNLGWKLAAVAGGAAPELLDTYEAERRPVAAHVLGLSNQRLAAIMTDKAIPTRRDASTIQLDIAYRGSVLARDDRDDAATLRAGDRAPDATGLVTTDGEYRLFDLIGRGCFTLLAFGTMPDEVPPGVRTLAAVEVPARDGEVADSAGHLARVYGATESTLVVIRPDGHVGLISDAGDSSAVSRYLTGYGLPR